MQTTKREQLTSILERHRIDPAHWPAFRDIASGRAAQGLRNLGGLTNKTIMKVLRELQMVGRATRSKESSASNLHETSF